MILASVFSACVQPVHGGVADDFRQRNIFPLPGLAPEGGEGSSQCFWRDLANQGIRTLNEITEGLNSHFDHKKKSTRAQRRVQSQILAAYHDAYPGPSCFEDAGGLEGLCTSFRLYGAVRTDIKSYARDNISWPQASTAPVPLERCLAPADREWLGTWQSHMLRSEDGDADSKVVPYIDPILKNDPGEYCNFLQELQKRQMVSFRVAKGEKGKLGVFFVAKKSGQLRLIFDTRLLNQSFHDPPSTDLPSADSFTRLEMPPDQQFFLGSGDLSNAFYTLSVPPELGKMFTLPCVKAGPLGISSLEGVSIKPDTQLLPYLTVLPMGWSWALHLCQMVLMNGIRESGIPETAIIGDKRMPVIVKGFSDIAVAGYVDNFGVFGCDKTAVNSGLAAISKTLRDWGLSVHEEEEASTSGSFVGLHFNGISGFMSIKPSRIVKIKSGIDDLLRRQFCTGRVLQLVLGHCTWAMMTRREGLSLIHHSYQFCHKHLDESVRLWPSVRKELAWISSLLPLFRMRLNCGWGTDVMASDSSPWGVGVCSRKMDVDEIRKYGGMSERWRYRFEDAAQARKRALAPVSTPGPEQQCEGLADNLQHGFNYNSEHLQQSLPKSPLKDSFSAFILNRGFNEIPGEVMKREAWSVVWSRPWKFEANILNTEARGLAWSIEHLLRANRNINKRLLCFSDNLPLVLGCVKGRAKSGHLLKPLRKIAGLCLATGSRISVRWVASELNVADQPSRAIAAWKASGWERWWDDFIKEPEAYQSRRGCQLASPGKAEEPVEKIANQRFDPCSPKHDLFGSPKCEKSNYQGLPETVSEIHHLDELTGVDNTIRAAARSHAGRVHERDVRERGGHRHWNQNTCSDPVLPSSARPAIVRIPAEKCQSFERLGCSSPAFTTFASASRSFGSSDGETDCRRNEPDGAQTFHTVSHIHAARRMFKPKGEATHSSTDWNGRKISNLGDSSASSRGHDSWENRHVRCHSPPGLRPLADTDSSRGDRRKTPQRTALGAQARDRGRQVQGNHGNTGVNSPGKLFVHPPSWGCHARYPGEKTDYAGGEAAWKMGKRCLAQKVCQARAASVGAVQSSGSDHATRAACASESSHFAEIQNFKSKHPRWNSQITQKMQKKNKALAKLNAAVSKGSAMSGRQVLKTTFQTVSAWC